MIQLGPAWFIAVQHQVRRTIEVPGNVHTDLFIQLENAKSRMKLGLTSEKPLLHLFTSRKTDVLPPDFAGNWTIGHPHRKRYQSWLGYLTGGRGQVMVKARHRCAFVLLDPHLSNLPSQKLVLLKPSVDQRSWMLFSSNQPN